MKLIRRTRKPAPDEVTLKELGKAVAISCVGLVVKWLVLRIFWDIVEAALEEKNPEWTKTT